VGETLSLLAGYFTASLHLVASSCANFLRVSNSRSLVNRLFSQPLQPNSGPVPAGFYPAIMAYSRLQNLAATTAQKPKDRTADKRQRSTQLP
ncbi:hypothetical protein, partial [Granulicella cerasi]|uniref:hypothetical protein n=1 Tax=Granulicella cerasi TaxID=741063 RepID=UPI0021DFC3E7